MTLADFCARCVTDEGGPGAPVEFNDMRWPERAKDELVVHLCEGCGWHAFDGEGWPICREQTDSWYTNPDQDFLRMCEFCWPPDG